MESKSLVFGIVGFIAGGLLVSIVASTTTPNQQSSNNSHDMSMSAMNDILKDRTGDDFDREFIVQMIAHHQGAVDMAKLADVQSSRDDIKQLSADIIRTQSTEIDQLKTWQRDWGFVDTDAATDHGTMNH